MSLLSTSFWIMCGIMWLLATPVLVSVISSQNLSGVEGFLMALLPWAVLLALIAKILSSLRGNETQ